jgi:hypothetical protein
MRENESQHQVLSELTLDPLYTGPPCQEEVTQNNRPGCLLASAPWLQTRRPQCAAGGKTDGIQRCMSLMDLNLFVLKKKERKRNTFLLKKIILAEYKNKIVKRGMG